MAGRRSRRDSDSSVATVNERNVLWKKETEVLRKKKASLEPNAWPIFLLNEATVYKKGRKELGNALEMDFDGPFVVRGRLDIETKQQAQRLVKTGVKSAYIEIRASHSYSIGYGPYAVVWISGEAGWFEINPSPRYKPVYDTICDAITLYYQLIDIYNIQTRTGMGNRERRKLFKKLDLNEVFYQHARLVGDGAVLDDVIARCDRYARFLLAHIPKEETFPWSETAFYDWISRRHPEVNVELAETLADGAASKATADADDTSGSDSDDDVDMGEPPVDAASANPGPPTGSKTKLASRPKHADPLSEDGDDDSSDADLVDEQTVVDKLIIHIDEACTEWIGQGKDVKKIRMPTIVSWLYKNCKVQPVNYKPFRLMLPRYSVGILQQLNPKWRDTQLFSDLKNEARNPPSLDLTHAQIMAWLVRRDARIKNPAAENAKGAAKTAAKKPPFTPPGRLAGKMAGLRPSSTKQLKRTRDEMEGDSADETRSGPTDHDGTDSEHNGGGSGSHGGNSFLSWRAARVERAISDEALQSQVQRDASPDPEHRPPRPEVKYYRIDNMPPAAPVEPPDYWGRGAAGPSGAAPERRFAIRNLSQVDTTPRGFRGAWQCEEDDCHHVEYRADNDEGQERVRAHIRTHEESADRLKLAVLEGGRGNISVDHLLDRIRRKGEEGLHSRALKAGERSPPLPIKRSGY